MNENITSLKTGCFSSETSRCSMWPFLEKGLFLHRLPGVSNLGAVGVHNLCIIQAVKCPSEHTKGPE